MSPQKEWLLQMIHFLFAMAPFLGSTKSSIFGGGKCQQFSHHHFLSGPSRKHRLNSSWRRVNFGLLVCGQNRWIGSYSFKVRVSNRPKRKDTRETHKCQKELVPFAFQMRVRGFILKMMTETPSYMILVSGEEDGNALILEEIPVSEEKRT